jgi:signal transduction histidine kinase
MSADVRITKLQRPLRVLLVEDSEADALLLLRALQRAGFDPTHQRVDSGRDMDLALQRNEWDLILADHAMPQFSAPEALELLQKHGLDLPFIIVSGHIEEDTAVRAMMAGAHDYVMKDRLARLAPAVERELREAEVRRARRATELALRRAHEELELRVEERTVDLHEANLQLKHVLQERQRLENELLEIAENERRRIGFDLHDDLGQKLTGVSMMIKGLEQQLSAQNHPLAADAGRVSGLVEELTQRAHDFADQFIALNAEGSDLPSVLEQLAANVKRMFGIACDCRIDATIPALSEQVIMHLYKISQEAMSNAIKHGKAKRVSIGLSNGGQTLRLTIENDGAPFSPTASKHRLGLRIMRYRANSIGATLEIKALEKAGTAVTCSVPLGGSGKLLRRRGPKPKPEAALAGVGTK